MDVELKSRDVALTDQVRDYVEKRFGRVARHLPDVRATRIELRHEQKRSQGDVHIAQVTMWVDRTILRAEEMHPDLFAAIDLASDKLLRQADRFKGKRVDRRHGVIGASLREERDVAEAVDVAAAAVEAEAESDAARIVRRKRFGVLAMGEAEAVEQFELLGHDFFVFRDGDTGMLNVLYRRRDGQIGLLEPVEA